jgi:hypothetical protein
VRCVALSKYLIVPLGYDDNVELIIDPLKTMTTQQAEEKGILIDTLPPVNDLTTGIKVIKYNKEIGIYYKEENNL